MRRILPALVLVLFAATIVLPLVWVLLSSLKPGAEIFARPWSLPQDVVWNNYAKAWREAGIGRYFFNSLIVTVGTLFILIPIGAMAAYALTKFRFFGSKFLFGTFLGGLMFPNFLVIVPLFFVVRDMGLFDTKTGLILVYVAYSLSFTIFVLSGFFHSLPNELAEAAKIDGCGEHRVFWQIMFPLAKPGLVVVAIFNAIGLWNEYSLALVLTSQDETRTLPLGIANLVMTQHYQSDWGTLFAGLVIVMLPVMIVYWFFRDRIHETMLAGAVKG